MVVIPLLFVVGVAALIAGVLWLIHINTMKAGRKELAAFKERVVGLSDKLDDLKERHKLLPHMNGSFTVPMTGETLSAYEDVATRMEQHRQEWLRLMDAWEKAQELLESERLFGSGRARSARKSLSSADAPAALAALIRDCEAPLATIENSHKQAAADLESFQQEDGQLGAQLQAVVAAALSADPYHPDRSAAIQMVDQARSLLPADPLALLRRVGEARGKIADLRLRVTRILEHAATVRDLTKKIGDLSLSASQHRSQGFLLQEEGSNPDPLLDDARQRLTETTQALNRADITAASGFLANATSQLDKARQGLERHVAAKSRCDTEIPARRREVQRLADAMAVARGQHAELTRDFAAESWLAVAETVQRAPLALGNAEHYLNEAIRCATAETQHYVKGAKLLEQSAENHKHVDAELQAIAKRLKELIDLRSACQTQLNHLRTHADRVGHLLSSNTADRASANERYRGARLALDRLLEDSRSPRPDWTRMSTRARDVESDLSRAEQLAKEDIKLAEQATGEIAETERVIREARSFREHGFTPDLGAAESELAQARGSLMSQGYEEAIRLANAAEQMARTAHQECRARALRYQQELAQQAQQAAQPSASPNLPAEAWPPS
jgi:chromosome segregation ATPase